MTTANQLAGLINPATGRQFSSTEPAGSVLQVVQNIWTNPLTYTANQSEAVTAFQVAITPSSSSSRILVKLSTGYYCEGTTYKLRLYRNGSIAVQGDANGSSQRTWMFMGNHGDANQAYQSYGEFLDSPATTSQITYTTRVICDNGATIFFNRSGNDQSNVTGGRSVTTMTAIEIAG